jgi:hypothetical protein
LACVSSLSRNRSTTDRKNTTRLLNEFSTKVK